MIRRPPRSTQSRSSAASDVYKRQVRPVGRVWPVSSLSLFCLTFPHISYCSGFPTIIHMPTTPRMCCVSLPGPRCCHRRYCLLCSLWTDWADNTGTHSSYPPSAARTICASSYHHAPDVFSPLPRPLLSSIPDNGTLYLLSRSSKPRIWASLHCYRVRKFLIILLQ